MKKNKKHYDAFVNGIFENFYDANLMNEALIYFYKLTELSPRSFLDYLEKLINNEELLGKIIESSEDDFFSNTSFSNNLLKCINFTIGYIEYSEISLKYLIKLTNLIKSQLFKNTLIDDLFYLTSISGDIPIPFDRKIDILLENCDIFDKKLLKEIVSRLFTTDSSFVPVRNSYIEKEKNPQILTIIGMNKTFSRLFTWLNENSNVNELINNIELALDEISYNKFQLDFFKNEISLRVDFILKEDDEIKLKIYKILLKKRNKACNFNNENNFKSFIVYLNNEINKIKFKDSYIKIRDILIYDSFPLINPVNREDLLENIYAIDDQKKIQKEKYFRELLKLENEYLYKLIDDSKDIKESKMLWETMYLISDRHYEIANCLIDKQMSNQFNYFVALFNDNELNKLLKAENDEFIIKNITLFKPIIFKYVDKKPFEDFYWKKIKNKFILEYDDFDYLFDKFLQFAPQNLITYFAYERKNIILEQDEKFLQALIKETKRNQSFKIDDKQEFIAYFKKLDTLKQNDKLVEYELELLHFFVENELPIPKLIKTYYAKNPEKLANFYIEVYKNLNLNLSYENRAKILNSCNYSFLFFDLIDLESLDMINGDIKNWMNKFLSYSESEDKEVKLLFRNCIIKMLSSYKLTNEIWPKNNVADAIEDLYKYCITNSIDINDFIVFFVSCFNNKKGARTIGDGHIELEKGKLFQNSSDFYKSKYPITSKILESISKDYLFIGENDKKESIF